MVWISLIFNDICIILNNSICTRAHHIALHFIYCYTSQCHIPLKVLIGWLVRGWNANSNFNELKLGLWDWSWIGTAHILVIWILSLQAYISQAQLAIELDVRMACILEPYILQLFQMIQLLNHNRLHPCPYLILWCVNVQ